MPASSERTDQVADIGVFRTIVIGGGTGNVAEIVCEHAVRQYVAQCTLIEVVVGVDKAGQHDHTRRVDYGRLRADIRAYGDDLLVLDQDVGLLEISDGGIVAEHHAAFEQGTNRAALGDRRPSDPGDGGRREQRGGGFHQSAPVNTRCCRSRQCGAVARVTHGAFLPAVSDPNLAAPNMSKTTIVDKRRSCSCAVASAPTLKDPRCRSGVARAWQ
jgi:hypothetical protein